MARWWNDDDTLQLIYSRLNSEGFDRRGFVKYVGSIGGTAAAIAAAIFVDDRSALASVSKTSSVNSNLHRQSTPSGELVLAQGVDIESLDPARSTTRSSWNIYYTFYETLTRVMFSEDGVVEISPGLATSWDIDESSDNVWNIKLQEGVKFQNGEDFNAESAKFTIDRLRDGDDAFLARIYARSMVDVEVVDSHTLRVTTENPNPLLPLDLTGVFMVPMKYTSETSPEDFAMNPVGTGPFKFVEWVPDDHLTVEANSDYWDEGPYLQTVRFLPIPEGSTRASGVATGDIDVATPISIPDVATLQGNPDVTTIIGPGQRTVFFQLSNLGDQPLADVRVRQALNYAVDKDAIVERVMQGYASVLQGQTISPQFFGFNPDLEPYPYDPDKAKSLLAEAGYEDGFDLVVHSPRGRYIFDFETSQAVAGMLQDVGINATVESLEWAVYIDRLARGDMSPMAYYGWATYNDGARMMEAFSCDALYSMVCLPEFDEVYTASRNTIDPDERLRLINETTQIQHDQALALFMFQLSNLYAVRKRVSNFVYLPNESFFLNTVTVDG